MGGRPRAPDPVRTAQAQAEQNRQTAITQRNLNLIDQTTPFGSLRFQRTGQFDDGTPRFEAVTELAPTQQGIFQQLGTQALGRLQGGELASGVDLSDPNIGRTIADRFLPRVEEDIARRRERERASLINAGFRPGSTGFANALSDFGRVETDARNQIEIAARQQAVNELLGQRNQNLGELGFLLSGGQTQQPQFVPTPQTGVQGTDISGLIQQNFAQQNQSRNSLLGAIAGLGANVAGFALSDRRAKEDIKHVGKLHDGRKVYSYRYKGAPMLELGVMAQEVEKDQPEAVAEFGGFKHVDYEQVTEHADKAA